MLYLPEVSRHSWDYLGGPGICPSQEKACGAPAQEVKQKSNSIQGKDHRSTHAQVHTPLIHMDGSRKDDTDRWTVIAPCALRLQQAIGVRSDALRQSFLYIGGGP